VSLATEDGKKNDPTPINLITCLSKHFEPSVSFFFYIHLGFRRML